MTPTFFIIGERKCGTSSLCRYLCQHPQVLPGRLKEPNFFGGTKTITRKSFQKYLDCFPLQNSTKSTLDWPELDKKGLLYEEQIHFDKSHGGLITGEASANTLVDADPLMVKKFLPQCKLIICLREPVARTWSHYRMFQRFKREGRQIGFDLKPVTEMVEWEIKEIQAGRQTPTVYPSLYMKSIPFWIEVFGKNQVMIISVHDLDNPALFKDTLNRIFGFLGICSFHSIEPRKFNLAPIAALPLEPSQLLADFFQPYNEKLFDYLDRSDLW